MLHKYFEVAIFTTGVIVTNYVLVLKVRVQADLLLQSLELPVRGEWASRCVLCTVQVCVLCMVQGVCSVQYKVCALYSTRCVLCTVQGVCSVRYKVCALYSTRCVLCTVQGVCSVRYKVCALYGTRCVPCTVQGVCSVQYKVCVLYKVCALYSTRCVFCTRCVLCTVQGVCFVQRLQPLNTGDRSLTLTPNPSPSLGSPSLLTSSWCFYQWRNRPRRMTHGPTPPAPRFHKCIHIVWTPPPLEPGCLGHCSAG